MMCATCAELPDTFVARTGLDDYMPKSTWGLKAVTDGDEQCLKECPTCNTLYVFTDERSFTGTGAGDQQTLRRLPAWITASIRGEAPVEALFDAADRDWAFAYLRARAPERLGACFPRMVSDLAKDPRNQWVRDMLYASARNPADARAILALMEATPHGEAEAEFEYVMKRCREHVSG